ncbi:hypothetical protein [Geothrix sp.]|jgi:hypothetical protein|uniref:hypothetical protein n=1 Tax=Geothrix sp. TaxID=1962974 RepID=UPI0025C205EE|nr:hypothetical protein [Geothrix sp.]
MTNPYRIDPEAMKQKSTLAQEKKLVTLQDDSDHPPPTIGTASWMSILGGPALGQPSSRHTTFQHDDAPFLFSGRFWLGVGFVGFVLYIIKAALFR